MSPDLLDRIDAWSRLAPERLAHISPTGQITYAELTAGSDALAAFIRQSLPEDGSPVAVLGHKESAMLLGFLGSVKAGHPYIPLDRSVPPHRVNRIIESAGVTLVLTPELIVDALGETTATPAHKRPPGRQRLAPSDLFYVIFTSGSTGEPKGVAITLSCLTSFLDWMLDEHHLASAEVFLNQAPFSFDLSVMDLYLSLVTGGTLVSLTSDDIANPRRLFVSLAATKVTTWVSTPSFAQLCLAEKSFDASMLPALRRFLFCGETLPPTVAAQLLERFPRAEVWNTYGPTEATVASTSVRIDREILARYASLPVGCPKPGSQVVVLDSNGHKAEDGQRGDIVIAGPNVSPGYFRRTDLTEQSFFTLDGQQAYRTGDVGHFAHGMLFFEGRTDNQVKLHGYRIELGEVEANLRALSGVRDAVVVPVYRNARVDSLAAFVITRGEPHLDQGFKAAQRLRRALAEKLPTYMVPRVVKAVAAFPMTANGKVDRRALAETLA